MAPVGRFAAVISLQGIEDVYAKLKGLGPAGEQAMRSLDSAVQNVKLDGLGQSVTRASGAVGEFRDGLHILHPILRAAGIEMGNFSAFSRAAGAGIAGLTVAVTGAALIGFAKLGERLQLTRLQLEGLFKDKGQGAAALKALEDAAKKTGTSVDQLLPGLTALVNLQEDLASKPGKAQIVTITATDLGRVTAWTKSTSLQNTQIQDQAKLTAILNTALLNYGVANDRAKEAVVQFFAAIQKNGGKVTGDMIRQLGDVSHGGANLIAQFIKPGVSGFNDLANQIGTTGQEFDRLSANIIRNGANIKREFFTLGQAASNFWDALTNTVAFEGVTRAVKTGLQGLADDINNFQWSDIWDAISIAWDATAEGLKGDVTVLLDTLSGLFNSHNWSNLWDGIKTSFSTATDLLRQQWQNFLSFLSSNPANLNVSGTGGSIVAPTGAQGGLLRGPGTSTSDSILARLSAGEFVVRAKAVQWYGADLLRAINSMRLPRDFMRGFNMGGLVDDMVRALVPGTIPRFAAGGMATANMRPVILNINGQQFGGLQGTQDAVSQLERYAVISNLRATGRSPGWNK